MPKLRFTTQVPIQTKAEDKFGGLPWGLDPGLWPLCETCKQPMAFVAQVMHDSIRLDLGNAERSLYVFQCEVGVGNCEPFIPESGATSAFVSSKVPGVGRTSPPTGTYVLAEARVIGWLEKLEVLPEQYHECMFEDDLVLNIPEDMLDRLTSGMKLGGLPSWSRPPHGMPRPPWELVFQIEGFWVFDYPLPTPDEIQCSIGTFSRSGAVVDHPRTPPTLNPAIVHVRNVPEGGWACEGPNFGNYGTGYVFMNREADPPLAMMFWGT